MSLAGALERAASALETDADAIRPANGDPDRLLRTLDVAAAARVLGWLLAHEPEAAEELGHAWLESPEGRERLLSVPEGELAKPARKGLRRILHRLRGRGIATPEAPPEPVVATLPRVEETLEAALVTPLDPLGARAAYLVEPHPAGGARLFELVLDPERGIVECAVYNAGRSGTRKFLREAQGRSRFAAVPVPVESLRKLVAEAAAAHPAERPLPRGFGEWRGRLTSVSAEARTPGELAREGLGTEEGSLARATELVRERRIGPWPPPEARLRELAQRLDELQGGPIVLSAAQRRERVDAVLGEALEGLYDAAGAARMAARFEETAYVLWKGGQEDDARACLAAARRFGDTPPAENGVARALLEVALAPVLERLREEEDPSLIVKP